MASGNHWDLVLASALKKKEKEKKAAGHLPARNLWYRGLRGICPCQIRGTGTCWGFRLVNSCCRGFRRLPGGFLRQFARKFVLQGLYGAPAGVNYVLQGLQASAGGLPLFREELREKSARKRQQLAPPLLPLVRCALTRKVGLPFPDF